MDPPLMAATSIDADEVSDDVEFCLLCPPPSAAPDPPSDFCLCNAACCCSDSAIDSIISNFSGYARSPGEGA
jgi:hypothetical protein